MATLKAFPAFHLYKNKRNILDIPILEEDAGLLRCKKLVIDWSVKEKKRVSNQYLFKDIKSIYSIDELNLISTYMFILNTTQIKNQPSDLISIESCWESEVGTYQES